MTSLHVICGWDLSQSKILTTPINWRLPAEIFWGPFFVLESTCACVLGLEHSCPRPREGLTSERLSLASSLVSSTPPLLGNSANRSASPQIVDSKFWFEDLQTDFLPNASPFWFKLVEQTTKKFNVINGLNIIVAFAAKPASPVSAQ